MDGEKKPLVEVKAATAAEICQGYEPAKPILELLDGAPTPLEFLDRLLGDEKHLPAAVDFLAHALPRHRAIWWACLCLPLADIPPLPPKEQNAVRAAVRWSLAPEEESRREAEARAKEAGLATPAGSLATAAFHGGGSVLPPDQPALEPPPTLAAKGVSSAIHLAVTRVKAPQMMSTYRQLVAVGIGIAMGKYPIPAPAAPSVKAASNLGDPWPD